MILKKLFTAMALVLVLAGVVTDTAMATATASNGFWYKGTTKLAAGTKESIACQSSGNFAFESKITDGIGTFPVKLEATGLSCVEGKIFNESSLAKGTVELKFTGVTTGTPCEIPGKEIITKPLRAQVYMEGAKALVRFVPVTTPIIAKFAIGPVGCALDAIYEIEGEIFAEAANATNVLAVSQGLNFSGAINLAASGTSNALTFRSEASWPATLAGIGKVNLTGGGEWKASET